MRSQSLIKYSGRNFSDSSIPSLTSTLLFTSHTGSDTSPCDLSSRQTTKKTTHEQVKTKHLDALKAYLSTHTTAPTDHRARENELRAYIEKEIQALPPKMRQIFEMSRKENLSYKEIAEKLDVSENNVSKQVNNALRVLRTKLGIVAYLLLIIRF